MDFSFCSFLLLRRRTDLHKQLKWKEQFKKDIQRIQWKV